ncbi:MAG: 4Fe-4S binding protein [Anaerolineae bacterium]|nr:4Fe-4S binding protein [Anaerolineae bacterium]
MELVVKLADQILTVESITELLPWTYTQTYDLVQRAYTRSILNKVIEDGIEKYSSANFYERLNHFAKFENWGDIPYQDRQIINRSFLDQFINKHTANIARKMRGLEAENALPNDTVMLLSEVEAMIDKATDIVVQPCDCRKLGENCNKPLETCIWLDESARNTLDRGVGRKLTKSEAKELLRWADKKGLMHTADSEWQSRGLHAICNCCACDCYPFRAAQELGSKGVWPKSRYIVAHDRELCDQCGACVKRCHFDAFYHDGSTVEVNGKSKQGVEFDPQKCWGCGLCANTCPENAIQMVQLEDSLQV